MESRIQVFCLLGCRLQRNLAHCLDHISHPYSVFEWTAERSGNLENMEGTELRERDLGRVMDRLISPIISAKDRSSPIAYNWVDFLSCSLLEGCKGWILFLECAHCGAIGFELWEHTRVKWGGADKRVGRTKVQNCATLFPPHLHRTLAMTRNKASRAPAPTPTEYWPFCDKLTKITGNFESPSGESKVGQGGVLLAPE